MIPAPKVYIDDLLMDSYKTENAPVLAGLEITYGTQSDMDMAGVESLSLELLIREPADLDFLENGNIIAVCHVPAGADGFTYFVGRIQRLSSEIIPRSGGNHLRIGITASDLTADLENETTYNIASAETTAEDRLGAMVYWKPDDWIVTYYPPLRFPERKHAAIVYKQKPYLELMDQFLRAQIMNRTNRSSYTPRKGVQRELTIFQDTTKDTTADKLTVADGGEWEITAGTPGVYGYGTVRTTAANIHPDAGWTKEPEDVITEVSVQRVNTWDYTNDTSTTAVASRLYVDTAASRRRFGTRSVEFATDLPAGGPAGDITPVFEHWLTTQSMWRAKTLHFIDTGKLSTGELKALISPERRGLTYLVVRDPQDNRPDRGTADIRGVVIGGKAIWTGKKWDLTVTLGRVPGLPADGNYWTFAALAADPVLSAGTAETVGNTLSFSDFKRIGKPS